MLIDNKSVLVTGGASGLGLATARAVIAVGARVVIADLDTDLARSAVTELGGAAVFVPVDVRNEEQVSVAVDRAAELGPIAVVVNCAGVGDPARTVGRDGPLDLDRFRRVVDINLVGTFNVIRLAAARMLDRDEPGEERGVIVNTASVAAYDGQIGQASYAASKGGIVAMTLPIARELASSRIRVVTIAPGMFDTPILRGLSDEARASIAAQVPHPTRLGDPSEYAALVLHVVSNPMINGETIRLDGGIRMGPR